MHHSIEPDELALVAGCLDLESEELIARRHPVLAGYGRRGRDRRDRGITSERS